MGTMGNTECQATALESTGRDMAGTPESKGLQHHILVGGTDGLCTPQQHAGSLASTRSMQTPTAATSHPPGRLHQRTAHSPANRFVGCISPASCALAARSCGAGGCGHGRAGTPLQCSAGSGPAAGHGCSARHDLVYTERPGGHHPPQSSSGACLAARAVAPGQEQPHACKQAQALPPHTQQWAVEPCMSSSWTSLQRSMLASGEHDQGTP